MEKTANPILFGAEKHNRKLNHFIWSCTRAYPVKHAFSLGDGNPLPNELNTVEAKEMLKKVAAFGVDNLFISGAGWTGEPLLRKDFPELIRYAFELKLSPYVKVTGWHFDRKVANELKAADCKAIICFAGLKETDTKLRGEGAFEGSTNAAQLCKEYGIPFAVSVINTKYIANQVAALVEFAIGLEAQSFHLASLIPQPIDVENQLEILGPLEPTPQQREDQLEEIYHLNKKEYSRISIVPYEMFNNRLLKTKNPTLELRSTCSMCDNLHKNEWLEILEDGKAYACAPLNLEFGDIRVDSIEQIMARMRTSERLKWLADRSNLKGKCGICDYQSICGGCRARAFIYTKDYQDPDPACVYIPKKARKYG